MPVTAARFREIALALPETQEGAHMAHPDFRVSGKIFATLGYPDAKHGMVKLTPAEQRALVKGYPKAFAPASGSWGKQGSTIVTLAAVPVGVIRDAIESAWYNVAPRRLH